MSTPARESPLATVVVTTHNRPEYVRRAVRSALAQTLEAVEVVLVDDGSDPPLSPGIDDPRLRVVRRERAGGMCTARNDGLAQARGTWVTFLDDDDELAPEMLETSLEASAASSLPSPVATMGAMSIVSADGDEIERSVPPTLVRGEDYLLEQRGDLRAKNALVMPTNVVRAIGAWDPQFEAFEADDFGIRLNHAASILGLDVPLYRMTQHGSPRLTQRGSVIPRDMERTVAKHPAAFRRHRAASAKYASTIGMYDLQSGRWASAVHWCLRGVLLDPTKRGRWTYLAAALAGPYARRAYRLARPREVKVSNWVLTKRRVRKYSGRVARYPRAAVAGPVARGTSVVVDRRIPWSIASRSRRVLVLCVYRERNAATVVPLVDEARTRGWDIRLWALDRTAPELVSSTVGEGAGAKFPLLNALLAGGDGPALDGFDWVVVADDDFAFHGGSLQELLVVSEAAGLDLVQPAHTELSHRDHHIGSRRALALARRTTFVEIGPVFAVRQPWIPDVLPFPADESMGWGLELAWHDLVNRGALLGIVDAVAIRHLQPVGKGYAKGAEGERLKALLRERGVESFSDVQRTLGTWRPWRSAPPWAVGVETPGRA